MRLFKKTNIDFMALRGKMYFLSTTIIVLGMISLFFKGVNYGIDFRGGTESSCRSIQRPTTECCAPRSQMQACPIARSNRSETTKQS